MFKASLLILSTVAASLEMDDEEGESLSRLFNQSVNVKKAVAESSGVQQGPLDVFYDNLWPIKPKRDTSPFPLFQINHDYKRFVDLLRTTNQPVLIQMTLMVQGGGLVDLSFTMGRYDRPCTRNYWYAGVSHIDAVTCVGGKRVEEKVFLGGNNTESDDVNEHDNYDIIETIAGISSKSDTLKSFVSENCQRKLPVDEFASHLTTSQKLYAASVIIETQFQRQILKYIPVERRSTLYYDIGCLVSEKSISGQQLFAILKFKDLMLRYPFYSIIPLNDFSDTLTREQHNSGRFLRSFVDVGPDWCQQLSDSVPYSLRRLYDIGLPIDRLV